MDQGRVARRRGDGVIVHDGYFFVTKKTVNNTRYLKCKDARQVGCPASIKVVAGDTVVINPRHNHPREPRDQRAKEFKEELMEACIAERGRLKSIYDRISLRNPEGSVHVPYNSIRSSMARRRRRTTPNIPGNLSQLVDIFESGHWPRYSTCSRGNFFSGSVTANGQIAVIFGNPQFLINFENCQFTFIDGTFKAVPRQPGFAQILTVFASFMDHAFPVIHVFMDRRTRSLYQAIFEYLHRTFPNVFNGTIVTDYEAPLVDALKVTFPEASLHGCFFHYCQAVMRKAKKLGVMRRIEEAHLIQGRILLKKYYCLALLPAQIIPVAFESLEVLGLGPVFEELRTYIRRQWIERVTPSHFSVFRQRHRTNNVMESYHKRLNSKLVRHPNIWDLMDTIIDIQNIAFIELEQLERHGRVYRIARKNVTFNSQLNEAWDKLADGRFNFTDFLRQAVHFVEGLDRQLNQWNEDLPIQEEEPILPIMPMIDPHPVDHLTPADPQLVPIPIEQAQFPLQFQPHIPPVLNEPPPLIYFHLPNPPSAPHLDLENIQPPQSPDDIIIRSPSPILNDDLVDAPRSPEHSQNPTNDPLPIFNIPENVGRAFARFDEEDDLDFEEYMPRWEPAIPVTVFDGEAMPEMLRCNVCYLNRVQYVMKCGHPFCSFCTARLFNAPNAVCAICRVHLNENPVPFYLN